MTPVRNSVSEPSKTGLMFGITEEMKRFSLGQVQFWLNLKYGVRSFNHLTLYQLKDFYAFLKEQKSQVDE